MPSIALRASSTKVLSIQDQGVHPSSTQVQERQPEVFFVAALRHSMSSWSLGSCYLSARVAVRYSGSKEDNVVVLVPERNMAS
jgi:hypothetical protein